MKIRCKSCGKRFDQEMYSGLCPRCGSYNRVEAEDSMTLQSLREEPSGEEAHRQMHSAYDSLGSEYEKWHDGAEGKTREIPGRFGRTDTYSMQQSHGAEEAVTGGKRAAGFPVRTVFLLLCVTILAPVLCFFAGQVWERGYRQERLLEEGQAIAAFAAPGEASLVLTHEQMEYPVTVTVQGSCMRSHEELGPGMQFYFVKARVDCDGYNFDVTPSSVYLAYQLEGKNIYRTPSRSSSLEDYAEDFGIEEEKILSKYSANSAGETEGYWIFLVEEAMESPVLEIMLEDDSEPGRVLSVGEIALEAFWDDSLLAGGEEAE